MDLELDIDEGIILDSPGVTRIGADRQFLQRLILTNKNVYYLYKVKSGLFSKTTNEVRRIPLSDIKIISGKPMVDQVKNLNYAAVCLQIQFVHGMEQFIFNEAGRRNSENWVNELYILLTGSEAPAKQKSGLLGQLGLGNVVSDLKKAANNAVHSVADTQRNSTNTTIVADHIEAPQNQGPLSKTMQKYCQNCGQRITVGAKFCSECGAPLASIQSNSATFYSGSKIENDMQDDNSEKVLRCPNCGHLISSTDVMCPACGCHFTGRVGSNSVKRLQEQLMDIENSRKQKTAFDNLVVAFAGDTEKSQISSKKVTLIRSYPIPNSISEIVEFVILAAGSIDVTLSKRSFGNKIGRAGNDAKAAERSISDAWVGKLQQAYQKAELTFSHEPIFSKVKEIYTAKMSELNMLDRG